jgi:hypothetical protein
MLILQTLRVLMNQKIKAVRTSELIMQNIGFIVREMRFETHCPNIRALKVRRGAPMVIQKAKRASSPVEKCWSQPISPLGANTSHSRSPITHLHRDSGMNRGFSFVDVSKGRLARLTAVQRSLSAMMGSIKRTVLRR